MMEDLPIINTLKYQGFSNIEIDQIFNYLEMLSEPPMSLFNESL